VAFLLDVRLQILFVGAVSLTPNMTQERKKERRKKGRSSTSFRKTERGCGCAILGGWNLKDYEQSPIWNVFLFYLPDNNCYLMQQ